MSSIRLKNYDANILINSKFTKQNIQNNEKPNLQRPGLQYLNQLNN